MHLKQNLACGSSSGTVSLLQPPSCLQGSHISHEPKAWKVVRKFIIVALVLVLGSIFEYQSWDFQPFLSDIDVSLRC